MKKNLKTTLVVITLLLAISINAQEKPFDFGIKAGINLSNVGGDAQDTDAKLGWQVGITFDYPLRYDFYLLSGLNLSTKGFKLDKIYDEDYFGNPIYGKATMNPIYLELPIHIGYKVDVTEKTKVVFQAGPYLAYGVGGKATVKIRGDKEKENVFSSGGLKEFDFGFGGGVGLEVGKIGVNLGYDFGFVNIADTNGNGKLKNQVAYLTVGYKF